MNPLAALNDGVKLIILGVVLLMLAAAGMFVYGLFNDRATVKNIKVTERILKKANASSDTANAKTNAAAKASDAAISKQIDALKDTKDEALRAELARPLPAEWVRLANCALRGAERESGCGP